MKIIDRYIVKQFLSIIFFGIIAFTFLFVIVDLMEKLDDFIDKDVPNDQIIKYYIVAIPETIRIALPISVLLSALFTVGKMSNLSELTAIKAGGVSIMRFMAPFLIASFLVSLFAVYFGGYVVPDANEEKVFIEQFYMKKDVAEPGSNIFFQDTPERIVTIGYYDLNRNFGSKISIQQFNKEDKTKLVNRVDAKRMHYDSTANSWELLDAIERSFADAVSSQKYIDTLVMKNLNFLPEDLMNKQRKLEEMTLSELSETSEKEQKAGNDSTRLNIEFHSRIALAFANFVVVLFGLPISTNSNNRKGGAVIQVFITLAVAFVYMVLMQISQAFGKSGNLNPFLTAWLANFFFLVLGIFNLNRSLN